MEKETMPMPSLETDSKAATGLEELNCETPVEISRRQFMSMARALAVIATAGLLTACDEEEVGGRPTRMKPLKLYKTGQNKSEKSWEETIEEGSLWPWINVVGCAFARFWPEIFPGQSGFEKGLSILGTTIFLVYNFFANGAYSMQTLASALLTGSAIIQKKK